MNWYPGIGCAALHELVPWYWIQFVAFTWEFRDVMVLGFHKKENGLHPPKIEVVEAAKGW